MAEFEAMLNQGLQAGFLVLVLLYWVYWFLVRLGIIPPVSRWGPRSTWAEHERNRLTLAESDNLTERNDGAADEQTDRQTDQSEAGDRVLAGLELDRTRIAVVRALVLAGWSVGDIRSVLKGDNAQIGQEINQVRGQLADDQAEPEPRMLRVGDGGKTRMIAR